ncbi:MAG: ATP synthase F1 subunit gamma [Candidatus Pacebacteria bacterium]|nr:ATP synthase F1 subunit gamma [Candidatus Paceibacterota bacterium]
MAGLKNIKIKIQSVKKTGKVTRAMEAVSAVKMRKSQQRALSARPYALSALTVLAKVAGTNELQHYPLGMDRLGKCAVVIVTSDKGLAGALNSSILKIAERTLAAKKLNKDNTVLICIGKRGAEYFSNRGYDVRVREENMSDAVTAEELQAVTQHLLAWHESGEIGGAFVIYTNFLSTFEQKAVVRQVIPLTKTLVQEMVEGIPATKGKFAGFTRPEALHGSVAYTIEPSPDSVLSAIIPRLLNVVTYHALMEAKASEHSARMVAMKNATDKSKEVAKDLTLKYNKARQAAITREVSEITSGIEAMR